jgi:hypothetical protein
MTETLTAADAFGAYLTTDVTTPSDFVGGGDLTTACICQRQV